MIRTLVKSLIVGLYRNERVLSKLLIMGRRSAIRFARSSHRSKDLRREPGLERFGQTGSMAVSPSRAS